MSQNSKISWTDHTFNPWWGCVKVSEGCRNCYAEKFAKRIGKDVWGRDRLRQFFSDKHWDEPLKWEGRVFCGSMCDVFEDRGDLDEPRERLWDLIERTPKLTWLLLTKRPENMESLLPRRMLPDNVRLGVTVENQGRMDRVRELLQNEAAGYFVSVEPMLGPVEFPPELLTMWVIVGGESGPGCRPFEWDWARSVRDQCRENGVPFFMKQGGGHPNKRDTLEQFPPDLRIQEFGK